MEETQTGQEATPASETDIQAGEAQTVAPTATPDTATGNNEVQATTDSNRQELPKGVKKEIWQLREKVRNLQKQISEKSEQSTLSQSLAPTQDESVDLISDPDKWAEINTKKLYDKVKNDVFAELEQKKEAERIKVENDRALDFLLSRPELSNDEDTRTEVSEILQRPDMADIANKYPEKAARLAYQEFLESRGIGTNRQAVVNAGIAATAPANKPAPAPTGKKVWTRANIEAELTKVLDNPEAYERLQSEIRTAASEGRIK